ncbi:hypothetical protein JMJ77_0002743 [Colletotrichum scovillei]|uniref:Uncharacterized protein n=1 Tax=Colletotrichum scovillei TaxID=1209932 RepID=A0A9P7R8H2_9PEZI|nr:hypothetical protein JMJ77_0002743 [Colletotrichum scovillei]KAG7071167.1 hypothetical protein JMJ76_0002404 [Colletotrichum scovillei]KAG7079428.1 hypothetical protein JMJ78_0003081 [Colletotrichum scovillei]
MCHWWPLQCLLLLVPQHLRYKLEIINLEGEKKVNDVRLQLTITPAFLASIGSARSILVLSRTKHLNNVANSLD